jgi:hypothetical protein
MVRLAVLLTGSQPVADDHAHDAFLRVEGRWQRTALVLQFCEVLPQATGPG